LALNPSYFSPYAYRVFAEVDPLHDWQGVIDTGYDTLFAASSQPLGATQSAGIPPDWVGLERATGAVVPIQLDGRDTTRYGYDAPRTYWRVALDARWSDDGRADTYLRLAGFLRDEAARKGYVSAVYGHDGRVLEESPSLVSVAGAIASLLTLDPSLGHQLFANQIMGGASRSDVGVAWGDSSDLYAQEWAWFATALYASAVPDLWHSR
jgi:endoglucanase